jgi:hypothetical protein
MTSSAPGASRALSRSSTTAIIDPPIGKIDIADWVRTPPDREYPRCAPPGHTICSGLAASGMKCKMATSINASG